MVRSSLLLCLLVALTSFVCVESTAMFNDALLAPIYKKILVKDSKGECKKEAMKHTVSKWGNSCAAVAAAVAVGLLCDKQTTASVVVGGVGTSIASFKEQMNSYIEKECARLKVVAGGVEKVKKARPKLNAVGAFNDNKQKAAVRRNVGARGLRA
ncbi:hypothetical protein AC1031_021629 [Aphanomyces cochlioides]|nr:hypothetical protein AC1031_021629 [Aphanomyces cochlioides]